VRQAGGPGRGLPPLPFLRIVPLGASAPVVVGLGVLVVVLGCHAPASAQAIDDPNPRGCRAGAARSVVRVVTEGLATVRRCHARKVGHQAAACNVLPSDLSTEFVRQENRQKAVIAAKCRPDDPSRQNFPACVGACDNILRALEPGERNLVQTSADAVLALDPSPALASHRCRRTIASAWSRAARTVLRRTLDCQRRIDTRDDAYGPLDASCLAQAGPAGRHAARKIAGACAALTGAAVGSCDPLPDCVVAEAQSLGQALGTITYGTPDSCGNGLPDFGEECDDGNAVDGDACTNQCDVARCGDGIVHEGVEECDDANFVSDDACDNQCLLPVCGDGVIEGGEECDDANGTPDDGCTACTVDATGCGAGGLAATVVYVDNAAAVAAGGVVTLGYPGVLDVPGTGPAPSVRQRVTNVSAAPGGTFGARDADTTSDGVDDTLFILFASPTVWPTGDFARVHFDCAAGQPIRPTDFACAFDDASDVGGNPIDPATLICTVTALEPIP